MLFSQIRQYVKGILANSFINKSTLDKLGEDNNGLTFNGNNIEPPQELTSQQMQEIKNAFVIDAPRNGYPVLFDETGAEHFVGWYKLANGTKKPEYRKDYIISLKSINQNDPDYNVFDNTSNINDDIVTRMNGVIHIENANQNKDIEIGSYNAEGILSGLTKNNANGNLYITVLSTNYGVSYSAKISAFYTKTTDQPQ